MSLIIKDLRVEIDKNNILDNFNLTINEGEIHALMGPNGVGKSTLAKVIMGDRTYHIKSGSITFNTKDITHLKTELIAKEGIFLSFQNPLEIHGVSFYDFLKGSYEALKDDLISPFTVIKTIESESESLELGKDIAKLDLNIGFSGGEKKKSEILQLKILKPKLIILDEIDSGLDVDSLKTVCNNINDYLKENKKTSVLIITHYKRLLDYLKPDFVHEINNGCIVKSGDIKLASIIEEKGYKN